MSLISEFGVIVLRMRTKESNVLPINKLIKVPLKVGKFID